MRVSVGRNAVCSRSRMVTIPESSRSERTPRSVGVAPTTAHQDTALRDCLSVFVVLCESCLRPDRWHPVSRSLPNRTFPAFASPELVALAGGPGISAIAIRRFSVAVWSFCGESEAASLQGACVAVNWFFAEKKTPATTRVTGVPAETTTALLPGPRLPSTVFYHPEIRQTKNPLTHSG